MVIQINDVFSKFSSHKRGISAKSHILTLANLPHFRERSGDNKNKFSCKVTLIYKVLFAGSVLVTVINKNEKNCLFETTDFEIVVVM